MEKIIYKGVDYTEFIEHTHNMKANYIKAITGMVADYFQVYARLTQSLMDEDRPDLDPNIHAATLSSQIDDVQFLAESLMDIKPAAE